MGKKIRNETRMSTLPTLIQYVTRILAKAIGQDEEIKEI
jgi:hypothetical protein